MTRDRLRLAIAAHAAIGSAPQILSALRLGGVEELEHRCDALRRDSRDRIERDVDILEKQGVGVILYGDQGYPERLKTLSNPPPILYYVGNIGLLDEPSVGMCGSRNASPEGLEAAAIAGHTVASAGLTIVSGNARGVDIETHLAAVRAGGSTIIVLAEGITRFRVKRVLRDAGFQPNQLLALSQFPPRQGWTVGGAMLRNGVIAALGLALVVIEAGETGGTLDAGLKGLELNRPVLALGFRSGPREGNRMLLERGARHIPSTGALREAVRAIRAAAGDQLGMFGMPVRILPAS